MSRYYNDFLEHYGVKGMKWGVRNDDYYDPGNNSRVVLRRQKSPLLTRGLAKISPKVRNEVNNTHNMSAIDRETGKKVGDVQLYRKSQNEMNVTFQSTNKKYGGQGYGRATTEAAVKYARDQGAKFLTAEVVGQSPNMLHITDTEGFVRTGKIQTQEVLEMWGGLTVVRKDL